MSCMIPAAENGLSDFFEEGRPLLRLPVPAGQVKVVQESQAAVQEEQQGRWDRNPGTGA